MQNPSTNSPFPKEDIAPSQLYPSFSPTFNSGFTAQTSITENPALTATLTPPLFQNCFARTVNILNTNQLNSERTLSASYFIIFIFTFTLLFSLLLYFQSTSSDISNYVIALFFYLVIFVSINLLSTAKNKNRGKTNEYQFYDTFFTVLPYPDKNPITVPYSAITKITESKGNIYFKINKSVGSTNKNYYEFSKTNFLFGNPEILVTFLRTNYPKTKYKKSSRVL